MAENPEGAPTPTAAQQRPLTEENQRALQRVQTLVKDTVRAAVADATRDLREMVDQRLATQAAPTSTTPNGTFPVGSRGVASMPSGGLLPPTTALSGMPVMLAVPTAGPASSSSLTPIMSLGSPATVEHDSGLQPMTPLASLLPPLPAPSSNEAVPVGIHSPPVPRKLAEKIWKGEFVELSELLPSRLGAPKVTLRDLMSNRDKPKEPKRITSIQQWVVCFNSVISVMALKHPERVQDLLGYSSMITKASLDYEGTPWLAYDAHFRRLAAANRLTLWSQVDTSLWTNYFTSAKLSKGASGLAIVPSPTKDGGPEGPSEVATGSRAARQRATAPYSISGEICRAWNFSRCTWLHCKFNHICMDCHSPGHPAKVCRVTRSLAETASDNPSPPFLRGGLRGGPRK